MDLDFSISDDYPKPNSLIPGFTNNKKGLQKLLGLVLVTSVLNQTTFIFERNMVASYQEYF